MMPHPANVSVGCSCPNDVYARYLLVNPNGGHHVYASSIAAKLQDISG